MTDFFMILAWASPFNDVLSNPFDFERGIHQEAPLSMRLYQIVNNDLLI